MNTQRNIVFFLILQLSTPNRRAPSRNCSRPHTSIHSFIMIHKLSNVHSFFIHHIHFPYISHSHFLRSVALLAIQYQPSRVNELLWCEWGALGVSWRHQIVYRCRCRCRSATLRLSVCVDLNYYRLGSGSCGPQGAIGICKISSEICMREYGFMKLHMSSPRSKGNGDMDSLSLLTSAGFRSKT